MAIYNRVTKGVCEKNITITDIITLVSQVRSIIIKTYDFLDVYERHEMIISMLAKIIREHEHWFTEDELNNAQLMIANPTILLHIIKNIDKVMSKEEKRNSRWYTCFTIAGAK